LEGGVYMKKVLGEIASAFWWDILYNRKTSSRIQRSFDRGYL